MLKELDSEIFRSLELSMMIYESILKKNFLVKFIMIMNITFVDFRKSSKLFLLNILYLGLFSSLLTLKTNNILV